MTSSINVPARPRAFSSLGGGARLVGWGYFLVALCVYLLPFAWNHQLAALPEVGDGPDYEMIAFQLWRGMGFGTDFQNPEYRRPYESRREDYQHLLSRTGGPTPTAYRAPVFPLITAATYGLFGRQFIAIRIINCLAMAGAAAITSLAVLRLVGPAPALLAAGLFLCDQRTGALARMVLTESLSCLMSALILWLLLDFSEREERVTVVALGLVSGMAVLIRSMLISWVGGITLWLPWIGAPRGCRRFQNALLYLAVAGGTLVPWSVRNCLLLKAFMPLGSQGAISLPAGYSDLSMQTHGAWYKVHETHFFDPVVPENIDQSNGIHMDIDIERREAQYGQARAMEWMRAHPLRALGLGLRKAAEEWRPHGSFYQALVLILAVAGLVAMSSATAGCIHLGLLIIGTVGISLTWSVSGRFLVAMLPILHSAAAIGLWSAAAGGRK